MTEINADNKELKKTRPHLFRDMKNPIMGLAYEKIRNQLDVEDLRNNMAQGNYPLSMSDCEVIGINGDCGPDCVVLLRGDCDCEYEMKNS